MRCPYCRHADSRVVDSREADDGQLIRRRRSCPECGKRFTTVEEAVLAVVKRSGVTEPFSRTKIVGGVRKACQGRPGRRGRDRAARAAGRGDGPGPGRRRDPQPRGRAGHPRARCGSWTRWPTCGSPASTGRSTRSATSSGRSRRCAPPRAPGRRADGPARGRATRRRPYAGGARRRACSEQIGSRGTKRAMTRAARGGGRDGGGRRDSTKAGHADKARRGAARSSGCGPPRGCTPTTR